MSASKDKKVVQEEARKARLKEDHVWANLIQPLKEALIAKVPEAYADGRVRWLDVATEKFPNEAAALAKCVENFWHHALAREDHKQVAFYTWRRVSRVAGGDVLPYDDVEVICILALHKACHTYPRECAQDFRGYASSVAMRDVQVALGKALTRYSVGRDVAKAVAREALGYNKPNDEDKGS